MIIISHIENEPNCNGVLNPRAPLPTNKLILRVLDDMEKTIVALSLFVQGLHFSAKYDLISCTASCCVA